MLDERSERYVSEDEEDYKNNPYGRNMQQRPERLVLKDLLVEKGTDYRDQLSEMAKGFPKVKKALNID